MKNIKSSRTIRTKKYNLVKSLQKALKILETFAPATPKLRLQHLVHKTNMPKTTILRILRTFEFLNYISFDPESKYYFLGPRVMSLGFTVLSSMDLRDITIPYLEELSQLTKQNVNLGILDGTEVIYIERVKKWNILNTDFHVGSRLNAYRTAIGRAILAFMGHEKVQLIFNKILKDKEAKKYIGENGELLAKLLEKVRRDGYAINDDEYIKGIRAIAAPIFNNEGKVEAAINIPVFAHMISQKELIERYLPLLLVTAEKISMARGFIKAQQKLSLCNKTNRYTGDWQEL
jgi:IclR family pca regulon transcriptional regulator